MIKDILCALWSTVPVIMLIFSASNAIIGRYDRATWFMLSFIAYILLEIKKDTKKKWK
jgi:hypothetical protein